MKTKFIYVVLAVLFMGSQMTLSAQEKDNKEKKQLMLDDATAAKFTPIYEKYLKELRDCRMMNREPRVKKETAQGTEAKTAKGTPRPVMTDAEIAKMLKGQFAQSRKMLDIREKFSKILSQKQIMKIYQQEKSNMNKFRKEFDRRKDQRPGQGHKPGQGDRQRQRQHAPHQGQNK